MTYTCPVCGYNELEEPPARYEICPCCSTEFGNDDFFNTHAELRQQWIAKGAQWWSEYDPEPINFDYESQLLNVPYHVTESDRAIVAAARIDALATEATIQSRPSKIWARTSGSSASAVDWPLPNINIFTKSSVFS